MAATYILYVFLVMQWHKKDIIVSRISILSFEWQWYIVVMFLFGGVAITLEILMILLFYNLLNYGKA